MTGAQKFGQKVKAYPLDETGPSVGFLIESTGDKDVIQVGAEKLELAYREPEDYDANGPNGTYCTI